MCMLFLGFFFAAKLVLTVQVCGSRGLSCSRAGQCGRDCRVGYGGKGHGGNFGRRIGGSFPYAAETLEGKWLAGL